MNTFLKASVERYPKDLEKTLIHPISNVDALIVTEIIALLKDTGLQGVATLLNQYKYLKDEELYNKLLDIHSQQLINADEDVDDVKTKNKRKGSVELMFVRNWIYFKDFRIDVIDIRSYEKHDEYKVAGAEMIYQIIFNQLEQTTAVRNVTTHKVVNYSNMERRDKDFEQLDYFISNFPGIKFINERSE